MILNHPNYCGLENSAQSDILVAWCICHYSLMHLTDCLIVNTHTYVIQTRDQLVPPSLLSCTKIIFNPGCQYHFSIFVDVAMLQGEWKGGWSTDNFPIRRILRPMTRANELVGRFRPRDYTPEMSTDCKHMRSFVRSSSVSFSTSLTSDHLLAFRPYFSRVWSSLTMRYLLHVSCRYVLVRITAIASRFGKGSH